MLRFLTRPSNDNAAERPNTPGLLLAPVQVQCESAHAVERMVGMGGLQPPYVRGVCRLANLRPPVVPGSVDTKYTRVVGEPSWVDLVQDG